MKEVALILADEMALGYHVFHSKLRLIEMITIMVTNGAGVYQFGRQQLLLLMILVMSLLLYC